MQTIDIKRIAIVGAGTMGHGIGQELARAGHEVTLYRRSRDKLAQVKELIGRNLTQMSEYGLVSVDEIEPTLGRIQTASALEEAVKDADLVIEAVVEDLELKQEVFRDLDRLCPPRTILASNTSSIMPTTLAAVTNRPDRVVVAHFSYPPHLIPLVEIVRGEKTSDETVDAVYRLAREAGKSPVIIQKEAPGFIINRMQAALQREALYIVEQGIASAEDVDIAVKQSFGRRLGTVGPIEMVEVQDGWSVTQTIHSYILPFLDATREPSPLIKEKVEREELGPSTGKGFYAWTEEAVEAWKEGLEAALMDYLRKDIQAS